MFNVYIVDDDPYMCQCLQKEIPWTEIKCNAPSVFNHALEALDALELCEPNIIVCDLKMPGMDGTELCRLVRERYPDVEVIFFSAYEDFQSAQMALRYGVRDYILKPICEESIAKLEAIIKKIVSEKSRIRWWDQTFDSELAVRHNQALRECNREYFECFFEDMDQHKHDGLKLIHHFCLYLMHILLDFVHKEKKLKEYTLLKVNEQKHLQLLLDTEDPEECIAFVKNCYEEILDLLPENTEKTALIDQVHELVEEYYMIPDFGVAWIADKVHLAPAYLSRVYAKYSQISLIEYITEYRIKRACELLRTTFLPISQISAHVGYRNINYFSKLFRTHKGKTPSEYRNAYHSGIRNDR